MSGNVIKWSSLMPTFNQRLTSFAELFLILFIIQSWHLFKLDGHLPDIVAPGVNILAAWTLMDRNLMYNVISGISMSTPHVSGIAALIKAANPSWSPTAIKSVVMTTAETLDNTGNMITISDGSQVSPFDIGVGMMNPKGAQKPGLVYDAAVDDYVRFLCAIGYDDNKIETIAGSNKTVCPKGKKPSAYDLNYLSIAVSDFTSHAQAKRVLTLNL